MRGEKEAKTSSDSEHTLLSLWTRATAQPVTPHHLTSSTFQAAPSQLWEERGLRGGMGEMNAVLEVQLSGPAPVCPSRGLWDCSMNCGSWPFHGRDSRALNWHDEINQEKKKKSTPPPAWTHVCLTHAGKEGGQHRQLWPAANTFSHIFGSNLSAGGDSIDHRCACRGNNRASCTGMCVCGHVQSRCDWLGKHHMGSGVTGSGPKQSTYSRGRPQSPRSPPHQTGARFANPPTPGSRPHAALQLLITVNKDAGQWKRDAQPPSSSSRGVGKDLKPSWVLINANYVRAVINLGTLVLADENKTIAFSLCECQRRH